MGLFELIVVGLETGSFIAVSAIGLTLVYGLVNMINFAHAEFMVFGAYFGVIAVNSFGLPIIVALLLATALTAIAGWGVARVAYMPIRDTGPIPLLVTSVGVGFILRYGIQIVLGPQPIYLNSALASQTITIASKSVSVYSLIVIGLAIVSFVALHLVLTRTQLGIALRAMGANEDLALVTGIDTDRLRHVVWLLASGLAGLSGFLLLFPLYAVPSLGFQQIILVITAAILGGAGSVYGAIGGAYVLGIAISVSTGMLLPAWGSNLGRTVAFVVLFLVLLVRPGGIAGAEVSKRREAL